MRFSLFATLACLAFSQAILFDNIDDEWSFDVKAGNNADWMGTIADSRLLSSLAIPGTHNSATDSLTNKLLQTQNVPLIEQLTGGIRYIDITCKVTRGVLLVYHGHVQTGYSCREVLTTIFDFLDQHQRETVILRIHKGRGLKSSKSFVKSFEEYFTTDSELGDRAAERLYTKGADGITTVPTLGELRGKVFILQDFKTRTAGRYGLPWNKDTVSSYSRRFSAGTRSIDSKWDDIKSHLTKAPSDPNKLYITHTTASLGVSPINFAARNAPDVGMNQLLGQYLAYDQNSCFGIVAMDFPGKFNVGEIIRRNEDYRAARPSTYDQSETFTSVGADSTV